MGHQRLGTIPTTRKWLAVVNLMTEGTGLLTNDVGAIASLTLQAAEAALQKGKSDPALQHTVYLLTQLVLAARQPDWRESLQRAGVSVSADASLFELTVAFQQAVDNHVRAHGRTSDIGEMAQQAAGEALSALAGDNALTLFGSGGEHVKAAIRPLSTEDGFSRLGQRFFSSFLSRFLNFYLSRVTAQQVGSDRLPSIGSITEFNKALETHCYQSARIVRDFCGEWYTKTEWEQGITPGNTSGFVAHAMDKLTGELGLQREQQ